MIAIPNMDKPQSCEKCPVHSFTCGNEYVLAHDYCRSLKKRFNVKKLDIDPFKEILPDCPLIDIVRCGECKHRPIKDDPDGADYGFNIVAPTDGDDLCPCLVEDGWYSWMPEDNFYCGRGERRT